MRKSFRHKLSPCPKCGMDSGERRKTVKEPAKFCVVCTSCNYRTGFKSAINAATAEWERKTKKEQDSRNAWFVKGSKKMSKKELSQNDELKAQALLEDTENEAKKESKKKRKKLVITIIIFFIVAIIYYAWSTKTVVQPRDDSSSSSVPSEASSLQTEEELKATEKKMNNKYYDYMSRIDHLHLKIIKLVLILFRNKIILALLLTNVLTALILKFMTFPVLSNFIFKIPALCFTQPSLIIRKIGTIVL